MIAGPTEPPIVQTARWLLRPIAFMESCRRRYGEMFGVRFLGFETPMVMLSSPEAIHALYSEPRHGLPPCRVFGVTDAERRERLRMLLPQLLDKTSSVALHFQVLLARHLGRGDPLGELRELTLEIDDLLLGEIAERRADPEAVNHGDILSLMAAARFEDGAPMSDRELRATRRRSRASRPRSTMAPMTPTCAP